MNENDLCCNSDNCSLKDNCQRYIKGLEAKKNNERVSWLTRNIKIDNCSWFIKNN